MGIAQCSTGRTIRENSLITSRVTGNDDSEITRTTVQTGS